MFLFHSKSTTSLNLRRPRSSKTSLRYIPCCGRSDFARLETFRFRDEDDYTSTRFSQYQVLLTFEPASFWRENVVAILILPRVLARKGSLSSNVFERGTLTGSGLFALLSRDFEQIFGQIVSKRVKTLNNINMVALRHI